MKASDWIYCSNCNREHHPSNLRHEIREEHREICTNPLTGGYLEKYRYEDVIESYLDCKCPHCGKILKSIYGYTRKVDDNERLLY